MRKLFLSTVTVGLASSIFADPVSAAIVTTDAGLAGKTFCWNGGHDQEIFSADHGYVYYWHPSSGGGYDKRVDGTWSISKNGTVTIKLAAGVQTTRYDVNGDQVKELMGSPFNYRGAPGKVC